MDNETKGLADWLVARNITDPELHFRLPSTSSATYRPTRRLTEVNDSYHEMSPGYAIESTRQDQRSQFKSYVVLVKEGKRSSNTD